MLKQTLKTKWYLLFFLLSIFYEATAQTNGRDFVRNKIREWGQCKNVAITLRGGDLALYGKNGWAGTGLPDDLSEALENLNNDNKLIDDVQLTENGRWLILYGDNGFTWNDIPYSLEQKLREFNNDGEVITQVTFNDAGDWIVIGTENIAASTTKIYTWIEEGMKKHGQLWAAHINDDGLILCYSGGYQFLGEIPEKLKQKLRETKIDVYRIKFLSDGAYFIADRKGNYAYSM